LPQRRIVWLRGILLFPDFGPVMWGNPQPAWKDDGLSRTLIRTTQPQPPRLSGAA